MLWLMLWPMLVSLVLWGAVALVLWARTAVWLAGLLQQWMRGGDLLRPLRHGRRDADRRARAALPAVRAARLADGALHPQRVRHAEDGRARRAAAAFRGSSAGAAAASRAACWNGVVALARPDGLWRSSACRSGSCRRSGRSSRSAIIGWVNQRLLRYDALAEHADREEMARRLPRRGAARSISLGLLLALRGLRAPARLLRAGAVRPRLHPLPARRAE